MSERVERLIQELDAASAYDGDLLWQAAQALKSLSAEKAALIEKNEEDVRFWKGQMEAHAEMAWYYGDDGNPQDWKSRAERAEAQLAEARGALEPFAIEVDEEEGADISHIELDDYRRAHAVHAALTAEQGEEMMSGGADYPAAAPPHNI